MRRSTKQSAWWMIALLVSALSWTACGDDDSSSDDKDAGEQAGRSGRAGRGGSGGKGGKGSDDEDGGVAGPAGSKASAGKGGSGGAGGSGSCYDGEPKQTSQYLNRCTDSECEPFDNKARLPLLDGDKLPPLP